MSLARYLLGLGLLVTVLAAPAFAALSLRRRMLPLWTGSPARLAEAVVALTIVLGVSELLGIIGLFRLPFVVGGCVVAAAAVVRIGRPAQGSEQRPAAVSTPTWATAAAVAAGLLVLAQWAATLGATFHGGMTGPDTLGYHGPIAATFVQRGSIVHPPFIYTDPAVAFFPATSELVHALGILLFSRDLLSPFINLAWLALALLAGWCLGRPRGLGPAGLLGTLVLLDVPAFSTSQPSSGDNDAMAIALLLTAIALLFNGETAGLGEKRARAGSAGLAALAGIAAGLSLATKVTMLAPVAMLLLAVVIALPSTRSRIAWLVGALAASGIWFVRNLVAFGSPMPALSLGIGPLSLPSAHVPAGSSVADYATNSTIWRTLLIPGLHAGLTALWPAILAGAGLGAVAALARRRNRLDRGLGAVALLSALAYAFTPRTGFIFLVPINLRYLGPALAIGLALLFRAPFGGLLRSPWALIALGAGVFVDLAQRGPGPTIDGFHLLGAPPHFGGTATMWVAIAVAVGGAGLVLARRVHVLRVWMALPAVLVLGLALRPAAQTYLRTRYATGPLAFARPLEHQRIAIVGFLQGYPAFGLGLSNAVTEISHHGPHGSQTEIGSCRAWRQALDRGDYRYVVTSPPYPLVFRSAPDYAAWTRSDPAASVVGSFPDGIGGIIAVFRIHGRLHPELCG